MFVFIESLIFIITEGALRVDVNVSINRSGEPLGIRTEIKNVGSIKAVSNAIDYEIGRQTEVLEHGGVVINETRAWDADTRTTVPMRDKEEKAVKYKEVFSTKYNFCIGLQVYARTKLALLTYRFWICYKRCSKCSRY